MSDLLAFLAKTIRITRDLIAEQLTMWNSVTSPFVFKDVCASDGKCCAHTKEVVREFADGNRIVKQFDYSSDQVVPLASANDAIALLQAELGTRIVQYEITEGVVLQSLRSALLLLRRIDWEKVDKTSKNIVFTSQRSCAETGWQESGEIAALEFRIRDKRSRSNLLLKSCYSFDLSCYFAIVKENGIGNHCSVSSSSSSTPTSSGRSTVSS